MDNVNITIISATNRAGSNTLRVARQIEGMLLERGVRAGLLTLEGLDLNGRTETLYRIERELLFPARKFIFVAPEYNGSYPGSLKTMIDLTDIKQAWWGVYRGPTRNGTAPESLSAVLCTIAKG